MTKLHPESAAIDLIGIPKIIETFGIHRQTVHYWRREGVPNQWRSKLLKLGKACGHDIPEMKTPRDRRVGRPPNVRQSPASPASPA